MIFAKSMQKTIYNFIVTVTTIITNKSSSMTSHFSPKTCLEIVYTALAIAKYLVPFHTCMNNNISFSRKTLATPIEKWQYSFLNDL